MSRILGLDVSTKTIGIAIFEDQGNHGKLQLLTHITPQVKPKPKDNIELLMKKPTNIFGAQKGGSNYFGGFKIMMRGLYLSSTAYSFLY